MTVSVMTVMCVDCQCILYRHIDGSLHIFIDHSAYSGTHRSQVSGVRLGHTARSVHLQVHGSSVGQAPTPSDVVWARGILTVVARFSGAACGAVVLTSTSMVLIHRHRGPRFAALARPLLRALT